jgi:hypothetical protein
MYFELFVAAALLCLGEIIFGRFEKGSPRVRRILKMAVFFGVTALLSAYAGRTAALAWVVGAMALALAVHGWWTRRNGIGFFSPEPWDRYRALRGWAR